MRSRFPCLKPTARLGRVAILWRGNEAARRSAAPGTSRFKAVFAALADVGVDAEPVVYEDDVLEAVRAQLATFDGVLVWVNPIHEGRNRTNLDALLREVAARGVWVSAHPDVILKMGTKEVLHRTRTMSWGCDTALYRTAEAMRFEFPARLATGPRVIKRNRGNGGQGVWKVETLATPNGGPMVRVLDATKDASEELVLDEFLARCLEYFEDGCVIDQPFQARLSEGVVRCYMAGDRCAGFGQQKVKALVDSPAAPRRRWTAALHFQCRPAVPAPAPVDGRRVDAAVDLLAGHGPARPPDDLGRGLHARAERRRRDGQLRAWRDQRQLGVPNSRRGARRDRRSSCRSAAVKAVREPASKEWRT